MQLTEQFHVPDEHYEACSRLTTLVQKHTQRLLEEEYWTDAHLDGIQGHSGQSYTYIRDDDHDAFADVEEYIYSRFKRCVYHRVTHILDAHQEEYQAFQFILDTVEEGKIRSIGWHRLRTRLFDDKDAPYIEWRVLESVVEQLNTYYDQHGHYPNQYTKLVGTPEPNGTLPYAPDKGDYHIHDFTIEDGDVVVVLNAPDSLSPDSNHDWTDHEIRFPIHARFTEMVETGSVKAPTLHASAHGYTLDVPVDVPEQDAEVVSDRALTVDLGVKKQATAVVLDDGDGTHEQVAPPTFIDLPSKDKLFRIKSDAEGINDRLAELRRQGKAHTERFDHLLAEYRRTRRRERHLRDQVQHDVANELVWLAMKYGCETIVFESLGQLDAGDASGAVAWSLSSWARGTLLDLIEYKAELVGIEFKTVNPWGTSRHCPRCGENGRTVKAPDDHTEQRHGGHFHCPECGYECDRDVVGAVNIGRKHLSDSQMEEANPTEYISEGNHASFPSPRLGARSEGGAVVQTAPQSGVQSATDQQDQASGRQTRLSQYCSSSLTAKRRETDTGGLHQNHGSNTTRQWVSGSVTRYVLASTTECG